jgi:peptidoglycan hydrolase-like protein with peptidoglycan-binding domain
MKRSAFRRQIVAAVVLILVTAVAVVGWVAGSRVQSPDTAAARAAPPDPSLITAPVELRVLSSRVVARGNVVPGQSATVNGPSSEDGAIVTGVRVEVGDELIEGNVVVEVSGRPVIVLEGPVPAFRAMKPGMRGTDIEELQASLDRLNCDTSSDEGVYGEATKECVSRMYEALGFETVPSSETEAKDLAEARAAVAEAEEQLQSAQAALDKAAEPPKASEIVAQETAVEAARRKIDDEIANAELSQAENAAAVDAAVMALNAFLADRASKPSDRAKAEDELEAAVLKAEDAERDGAETVLAAQETLAVEESKLEELNTPADVSAETVARDQAQGSLDRANETLAELESRSGPQVPLGEVVFVSALPATVNTLSAAVGEPVGGGQNENPFGEQGSEGLAVLATSALRVEVLVAPSDADLVEEGMDVELLNDGFAQDEPVAARLDSIGDQVVQSSDGNGRGFPAVIEAIDPIPRAWTGSNVRVTFTAAATPDAVLVVPLPALSSGADGGARVEVLDDDGTITPVPVEAGLSAEGFVEVTPIGDAELNEGDQVIVGNNTA